MTNQISYIKILETIYALSALKVRIDDPDLPGPLGRDDAEALEALAREEFEGVCVALGCRCFGDSVDLPGDHRKALEEIVTDRMVAALTGRAPYSQLLESLRARLRPVPKSSWRY